MKDETLLSHAAHDPETHGGAVNVPVYRTSTILYPDYASYRDRFDRDDLHDAITYGARGSRSSQALAEAVAQIEGGHKAAITSTGLSAVTMAIAAFVGQGDHVLMVDTVYSPTRNFCDHVLTRWGVETTYYDPTLGAGIADLMRKNTRVVFVEAPGSMTFEMQDIPAIAQAAHTGGAAVLMDNTWASPLFFKPFTHGVDVSIQAGTKYISGHSDLVLGTITSKDEETHRKVKDLMLALGEVASPDDCFLALRGLRTLAARLHRQQDSALQVTRWLAERPEVKRVLYPALPSDPGHELWKRDFLGASSLFGLILHTSDEAALERMINALRLFLIGSSWGGYESLLSISRPSDMRTATTWNESPWVVRLHVGLEDPGDLIADLEQGLRQLAG